MPLLWLTFSETSVMLIDGESKEKYQHEHIACVSRLVARTHDLRILGLSKLRFDTAPPVCIKPESYAWPPMEI